MATEVVAGSGQQTLQKIYIGTGMKSENTVIHRCFQSDGVPDGNAMDKGDLCWDYGNSDAYICTVTGTVVKMNA